MSGSANSPSVGSLTPEEVIETRSRIEGGVQEEGEGQKHSEEAKSLGEKVREEVRNRLGQYGDKLLDEDGSEDVEILEQEEVQRGTRGLGGLWKLSLGFTLSLAAYLFITGPRIEPNWIPNFTERDPVPKIYRPEGGRSSPSSRRTR